MRRFLLKKLVILEAAMNFEKVAYATYGVTAT